VAGGWSSKALLEPIAGDRPCGDSLDDSPLLSAFDVFRLFGQTMPLKPVPAWPDIQAQATEALARSKDLRLLAYLGAALLRTQGLPAFCETLDVAAQWLEADWEGVYPGVDEDAIVRRSALNCFADPIAVVDGLRRTPLVSHVQLGRFGLRDVEMAEGVISPTDEKGNPEPKPDLAQIHAAFRAAPLEELTSIRQSVTTGLAALSRMESVMREKAGTEFAPAFEHLSSQLKNVDALLRARLKARPDGAAVDNGHAESSAAAARPLALGPIANREDALRALEAVADFFRRTEPSSPVPLFVERAKRLVSKDFLEVLADVAPGALDQARAAGGLKSGE
jgi:type VI secretion system protein ImpA